MSETMRAVIADGQDTMMLVDRPVPEPGAGEARIRMAAAGVNRPDIMQRTGALPTPPDAPDILGLEVAGHVEAVGDGVDPVLMGRPVMALVKGGGYAERVVARADHCLPVPEGLSLTDAAALPEGLFTIWLNLFDRGGLAPGDHVLIEGGAGGIGTLALQLVLSHGARPIVTAGGPRTCAVLEAMGADAIDYRTGDLGEAVLRLTDGRGVDVVLDILGGDAVNRHLACMAPGGRHIGLSFMQGMMAPVDLGLVMRKGLWLSSSTLRPKTDADKADIARAVRDRLLPLVGPDGVRPVISRVLPLRDAMAAHDLLDSGGNIGKVVLTPTADAP